MINLHFHHLYLAGARDILLRLRDDYDMYLIPAVKRKCKPSSFTPPDGKNEQYFALSSPKLRRLIGQAVCHTLTNDREQLRRYLQGGFEEMQVEALQKDKKGNITSVKITFK